MHKIQKGFLSVLSSTFEHPVQMANIINNARIKQRPVVIMLLNFKNAFGEVLHNLISEVLNYHHIPDQIQILRPRSHYSVFEQKRNCLAPFLALRSH